MNCSILSIWGASCPSSLGDFRTYTRSQYLDIILNAWGGWELFQHLLSTLRDIADRHSVNDDVASIANIATRWVLDQPAVGSVIVGKFAISDALDLHFLGLSTCPGAQTTPLANPS